MSLQGELILHPFHPFLHSIIYSFIHSLIQSLIDALIDWFCDSVMMLLVGHQEGRLACYTRVSTHPGKSWIVLKFKKEIFQAWKVMENDRGHGKLWNSTSRSWNFLGAYCISSL